MGPYMTLIEDEPAWPGMPRRSRGRGGSRRPSRWCSTATGRGSTRSARARAGAAGEDLAAEAFRIAFDRRDRYDRAFDDAAPWLYGIATLLLRQHFRSEARGSRAFARAAARLKPHADEPLGS